MPWIDPLSTATTPFLGLEAFCFSLQTLFAYPYSTSLFVTYYEERFFFSVAYFAFH
jgi:hypothetical protein